MQLSPDQESEKGAWILIARTMQIIVQPSHSCKLAALLTSNLAITVEDLHTPHFRIFFRDSFSAVPKPNFAINASFESAKRILQDDP